MAVAMRQYFLWTLGALGMAMDGFESTFNLLGPLAVAFSNNLKSKKYYLSIFGSNNSGK